MADDFTVIFLAGLAAFFGLLVLVPLLSGVLSWLARRLGLPEWLSPVTMVGLLAGLVVGGSLYLDTQGIEAPGIIQAKSERIDFGRTASGSWTRRFLLSVTYPARDGQPRTAMIGVDEARFDTLRPGAAVRVRYLPEAPVIARLAEQSTLTLVPWDWVRTAGLAVTAIGGVWFLIRRRAPRLLTGLLIAGCLVGLALIFLPLPWEPEPVGPRRAAIAEVRAVQTITRSLFGTRSADLARQPWEVVELVFVPDGRDQPVVAVDSVDRGTVAGLTTGALLPVSYPIEVPRSARLIGGNRTYLAQGWQQFGETAVWIGALVGGLFALLALPGWLRRRRGSASPRGNDPT